MAVWKIEKHVILCIIFLVVFLTGIIICWATSSSRLAGKIIIIDAGHGGIDPGANRPGILEKDINLAVALYIKNILNSHGAKVILSRESDVDLSDQCDNTKVRGRYHKDLAARLELVEKSDADLFVSIHANSNGNAKRRGAECFYSAKSAPGKVLANTIQAELHTTVNANEKANPGNYFVLRRNKVPAVLIEAGYITNREERTLLMSSDYQQKLASAIASGIIKYYQTHSGPFADP